MSRNFFNQLSVNAGKIKKYSKKLTSSSGEFRGAVGTLAKGTRSLFAGVKKLVSSTGQVSNGIDKLADGAVDLYDGMKKFQNEGTDKLSEAVNGLLDGSDDLQDNAKAVGKAADQYRSFSGISDKMEGKVKFIMTTQEIKVEE